MPDFKLDDYIDVAERLRQFYERYPDGRITRLDDPRVMEVGDKTFIVYSAVAYRDPEDPRPCVGTAWEPFPGRTPYTRDSELMNAETAAWGRAIIAAGIPSKRIASADEVAARQAGGTVQQAGGTGNGGVTAAPPQPTEAVATAAQRGKINAKAAEKGLSPAALANIIRAAAGHEPREMTDDQAQQALNRSLDRLPRRLVDPILEAIAAVGQPPAQTTGAAA
ncbi:MAG TPA: hypothetical protein VN213_04340 [Solirubrobacteraceae bacterium]|nr:hypothetical protein [Solirubrobacteraceae bacterium]